MLGEDFTYDRTGWLLLINSEINERMNNIRCICQLSPFKLPEYIRIPQISNLATSMLQGYENPALCSSLLTVFEETGFSRWSLSSIVIFEVVFL